MFIFKFLTVQFTLPIPLLIIDEPFYCIILPYSKELHMCDAMGILLQFPEDVGVNSSHSTTGTQGSLYST